MLQWLIDVLAPPTDPLSGLGPDSIAALTHKRRKGRMRIPKKDPRPKKGTVIYTLSRVGKAGVKVVEVEHQATKLRGVK